MVHESYQSSVFTITSNGKIYAAYILNGANRIIYFPSEPGESKLHPAIYAWYETFGKNLPVVSWDNIIISTSWSEGEISNIPAQRFSIKNSFSIYAHNNYLTSEEVVGYKKITAALWNPWMLNQISMNRDVANILDPIPTQIKSCVTTLSTAFLIPLPVFDTQRPDDLTLFPLWAANSELYIQKVKATPIISGCAHTIAAQYRNDMYYYGMSY